MQTGKVRTELQIESVFWNDISYLMKNNYRIIYIYAPVSIINY